MKLIIVTTSDVEDEALVVGLAAGDEIRSGAATDLRFDFAMRELSEGEVRKLVRMLRDEE